MSPTDSGRVPSNSDNSLRVSPDQPIDEVLERKRLAKYDEETVMSGNEGEQEF